MSKGIELMIWDILEEINPKFNFRGACEKLFDDPTEYIKLTDSIIEKVEDIYDGMKETKDDKYWHNF